MPSKKRPPERATQRIQELKTLIEETEHVIEVNQAEYEEKLPVVESRTAPIAAQKKKVEEEISEHKPEEDRVSQELVLAQSRLVELQSEEENQRSKHSEMARRLADMEQQFETKSKILREGKEAMPRMESDLERVRDEINELDTREGQLRTQSTELLTTLEQSKQTVEANRSTDKVLRGLMRERREGRIPGIMGRLGDLGAIDEKYDVAISTTCGALENILVDTVETAQLAIQFLKRENLGLASFIALDKQQRFWPNIRNKPKTPENTPRLFDLVRVEDDKVLPAFYFALADTLIADNIEVATRISTSGRTRWRVVTLKGEVVDTSGSMTGGGNAQKRGAMGQRVRSSTSSDSIDVRGMEESLQRTQSELADVRNRLSQMNQDFKRKTEEYSRLDTNLKNIEKTELKTLQSGIASVKKSLETQEAKLQASIADPVKVQQERDRIQQLTKDSEKLASRSDTLRMKLIDLDASITAISEEVVGVYEKLLSEARDKKKKAEEESKKQKSALSMNDRNLSKAQSELDDLEKKLERADKTIQELDEKRQQLEERIGVLRTEVEQRREEARLAEADYQQTTNSDKQLNEEEFEMQQRIKKLDDDLQNISNKISACQSKKREYEGQKAKLKIFHFGDAICFKAEEVGEDSDGIEAIIQAELGCLESSQDVNTSRRSDLNQSAGEPMDVDDEYQEEEGDDEDERMDLDTSQRSATQRTPTTRRLMANLPALDLRDFKRSVPDFHHTIVDTFDLEGLQASLAKLEAVKGKRKDTPNLRVAMDYLERMRRYEKEYEHLQEILHERDLHRELGERLRKQRLVEFMGGYREISERLKEMYQMITLGGDASLDLVNSLDPFSDGISFSVRPPKKSWKQICNLSGGEKTLASLALILGLHHYRPSPFYVMDEIDAALDYRNVSITSHLIKERTQNAQFIIISLRNNMFENGDRVVGIYKVNDCTRNVVVENTDRAVTAQ